MSGLRAEVSQGMGYFGNRQVTTAAPPVYGWTGQQQRATNVATTVVRMGVRLYDPTLGRFLSKDPLPGGSAHSYDYCFGDPVNCFDLWATVATTVRGLLTDLANLAGVTGSFLVLLGAFGCAVCLAAGVLVQGISLALATGVFISCTAGHRGAVGCAGAGRNLVWAAVGTGLGFGALRTIAAVYEPLGLVPPRLLLARGQAIVDVATAGLNAYVEALLRPIQ